MSWFHAKDCQACPSSVSFSVWACGGSPNHIAFPTYNLMTKQSASMDKYVGLEKDKHGITQLGRVVLDARLFGFIPDTEDCGGWDIGRMQALMDRVDKQWDQYGNLPSRLPPALAERHTLIYTQAIADAKKRGWNAELGDDE